MTKAHLTAIALFMTLGSYAFTDASAATFVCEAHHRCRRGAAGRRRGAWRTPTRKVNTVATWLRTWRPPTRCASFGPEMIAIFADE